MATNDDSRDMEAQRDASRRRPPYFSILNRNGVGRNRTRARRKRGATEHHGDTSAGYWKLYMSEAEESDQKLVDDLTGDTNSMLILNALFSAIVAGFIIETYKSLQPDNSQQTVDLLSQLVVPPNSTQSSPPPSQDPDTQPFTPSNIAIRLNILMFLSLFLNMTSVLASVLIQQWCREFMKYAYPRVAPHKRGRVRTYLYRGLNQFQLRTFMYGIHVVVHVSVFLFFWALSDFLYTVHATVGSVSRSCLLTLVAVYMALSISPLIISNSPYNTALTTPLRFGAIVILFLCRFVWRTLRGIPTEHLTICGYFEGLHFDRARLLLEEADARAAQLDPEAMEWMFTANDFSDTNMDKFLEGLPGYIHSPLTDTDRLTKVLTAGYILKRIREHFMTCATSLGLSEDARMNRVVACVNSLRTIFKLSAKQRRNPNEENTQKEYIQGIIDDLNTLCDGRDSIGALRASCVRGLAFRGLLAQSAELEGDLPPTHRPPTYLIPLHTFLYSRAYTPSTQKEECPAEVSSEHPTIADDERQQRALLCDGPLINLTLLARAILSNDDVDPPNLSLCWKTLDILRTGLGIALVDVSDPALALFDEVHDETRRRVQAEERGFRITPLLDVLDSVARGRRLSVVLRDHPKFRSRPDGVFEKDHLQNPDIFHAFANCLPDFISKNIEKSAGFMEDLVCYDELWTTLQVILGNSFRSDSSIPEKLQIFDICCTVIDEAFVTLENSPNVDWRTPEFGHLAHYFELFVTNCFQGTFVGRATAFRAGLIKARFCRAVLAQFKYEVDIEGAMVFRSQWDVAALARLFYTLGVGNEEDVNFWKQFVDGGHIGAEFMVKAHEMLSVAVRDGPLLNFVKLGHLATTAVPLEGSGLEGGVFWKLVDLLQKMIDDTALPLELASSHVWRDLRRLRDKVRDISTKSSDGDKARLDALLMKIKIVLGRSPYPVQGPSQSDHIEAEASGSSVVGRTRRSLWEVMPGHGRSSLVSASTAVAPDQYEVSSHEDSGGFLTDAHSDHTNSALDNSHNERGIFYSVPYPHLPSQAGFGGDPGGLAPHPIAILTPLVGSAHSGSSGTTPIDPSSPDVRSSSRRRLSSAYYPPGQSSLSNSSTRSSPPSNFRSPRRVYTKPTSAVADSPSSSPNPDDGVQSSSPPASPVMPKE